QKLNLAQNPGFFAAHGVNFPDTDPAKGSTQPLAPRERKNRENLAARLLLGGINIAPIKNSSLINITYTSRSPEWSARLANAWPQEFIGATIDLQFASTADAR